MDFIPLSSPDIQEKDINAVVNVLRSGMLVQGENVERFEAAVSELTGSPFAVAVSNGTATMHLSLIALGIGIGDEVIVPAFSYVATANVVELVGAKPVFVDIDINTFNIDVNQVENAITSRTKAIIPVHEFGLACDIEAIMIIANKYGLYVIEDAACALGATQNSKSVGTFGNAGSFSFHPRKAISSGEGGMITVNDKDLSKELKILRNHGLSFETGKMDFVKAGYNYRMTDFQAALVVSQMERFQKTLEKKRKLANIYLSSLKGSGLTLPLVPTDRPHTWQTFHVLVDNSIDRDNLIIRLRENGVGTNYGAQCIPAQTYYFDKYDINSKKYFPNAWLAYTKGLALPLYEKLSDSQIEQISQIVKDLTN